MFVGVNYPDFKIWLHFVNDELAPGFDLDALRSSHPIEVCFCEHVAQYLLFFSSRCSRGLKK